jgi:Uma2 family endonuclease
MAVAAPKAPTVPIVVAPEQRMVLSGISWATYESLLADHIDRGPRFAYDRGLLEIMTTGIDHERESLALAAIVEIVADELGIEIDPVGSMTLRRGDLQQGVEPDASFYIQNVERVRDKSQIHPSSDPPPDLMIEVDFTNSSLNRFPIFAGLGVPEVWRYSRGRVTISALAQDQYIEVPSSRVLPPVTAEALTRFLAQRTSMQRAERKRTIRAWLHEQTTAAKRS